MLFCVSFLLTFSYLSNNKNKVSGTQQGTLVLSGYWKSHKPIVINLVMILKVLLLSLYSLVHPSVFPLPRELFTVKIHGSSLEAGTHQKDTMVWPLLASVFSYYSIFHFLEVTKKSRPALSTFQLFSLRILLLFSLQSYKKEVFFLHQSATQEMSPLCHSTESILLQMFHILNLQG